MYLSPPSHWSLSTAVFLKHFLGGCFCLRKFLQAVHLIAGELVLSFVVDNRDGIVNSDLALE